MNLVFTNLFNVDDFDDFKRAITQLNYQRLLKYFYTIVGLGQGFAYNSQVVAMETLRVLFHWRHKFQPIICKL